MARIKVFLSLFCAPQLDEQKQVRLPFLMRSDLLVQAVCILISNTFGSKVTRKIPELLL